MSRDKTSEALSEVMTTRLWCEAYPQPRRRTAGVNLRTMIPWTLPPRSRNNIPRNSQRTIQLQRLLLLFQSACPGGRLSAPKLAPPYHYICVKAGNLGCRRIRSGRKNSLLLVQIPSRRHSSLHHLSLHDILTGRIVNLLQTYYCRSMTPLHKCISYVVTIVARRFVVSVPSRDYCAECTPRYNSSWHWRISATNSWLFRNLPV